MTEAASRFVGAGLLRGRSPERRSSAPSSSATRCAAPSPAIPQAEHEPIGHLELAANCDAYPRRPSLRQHRRQAGGGDGGLDAHHLLPCLRRPSPPSPGDERPDVRRRGDPGQPGDPARARRDGDRARARARSPRVASSAGVACPIPPTCWPGSRRRCRRAAAPGTASGSSSRAGGTREPIDPVRFIGNRSSGRMGLALAAAAARRGADVTLIAANVALPTPPGIRRMDVETAEQLANGSPGGVPLHPRPSDGGSPG